jgi:hypothetical protein
MKITTRILPFIIFLFLSLPIWSEVSAIIVDLDGEVMISRNGIFLDESEIDYGTELFSHDILQTGQNGYVELSIQSPVSSDLSVKVLEGTTLFLEHTLKRQHPETSLTLHRGAVQTKAASLIQGASFNIKTDSSVMGIRGTTFTVTTSPDTAILVSCREGSVVCTTDGKESLIQPGKIYETNTMGQFRVNPIPPEEIDQYTTSWKKARLDALANNGILSLEHYASLYLQMAPGFLESYAELTAKQDIFQKWETIIREGRTMSMGEATRDKIALSNGIIRLRSRLPVMEHIFYTLYDLTALLESSGKDTNELSDTANRTLMIYNKRQQEFIEKLTKARYYFKVFLEIDKQASGHSLMPSSDLMDDFLLDDTFFITPPAPGQSAGSF